MRRTIVSLTTMALTLLVASGVVLAAGIGSAGAQSSVVGPGESIQKAINAAIRATLSWSRGVHGEDVVIRKNGIKLRGDDATLKPPARAGWPCSKAVGPEGICILGDVDPEAGEVNEYVKNVSVSGFTIQGFDEAAIEAVGASNATIAGNRAVDSGETSIGTALSVGTRCSPTSRAVPARRASAWQKPRTRRYRATTSPDTASPGSSSASIPSGASSPRTGSTTTTARA